MEIQTTTTKETDLELSSFRNYDTIENVDNVDYDCDADQFEFEACEQITCVKGRLKEHVKFWEEIGANEYILSVIKNGYKIPFVNTPPSSKIKNNKSAMDNSDFVTEAISELIKTKSVIRVNYQPKVVNPLTVAINEKGKKRLVLDLRHVNPHVAKEKIKFDDWKVAQMYINNNSFMFGFDLKSGYHHIDIEKSFYQYLGFEWELNGEMQYFVFTVLPFGLSSAGHIFTKTVRCLISHWRAQSIKILAYLDDGFCAADNFETALKWSKIIRSDLILSGFVSNEEKSQWFPIKDLIFLGIGVNTVSNVLYIPEKKKERIIKAINKAIRAKRATARQLAALTGKLISTGLVLGNVTLLMTKYLHMSIMSRQTWDSYYSLSDNELSELIFWSKQLPKMGVRSLHNVSETMRVVYSDASSVACGGFMVGVGKSICHRAWSDHEKVKSSTWRELVGVYTVLHSMIHLLRGKSVKWFSDNQGIVSIVKRGSMKPDLQEYAIKIYNVCIENNVRIEMEWIPRSLNEKADYISNIIDYDDWFVTDSFFKRIDAKWGKHTFDRFANFENRKICRFNSKFWTPGSLGIDAFTFDWSVDNNWMVPPIYLIPRVLSKLKLDRACGTLIVPKWRSAAFWPMLIDCYGMFHSFVEDYIEFTNVKGIFRNGSVKSIFNDEFKSSVLALRVSFK